MEYKFNKIDSNHNNTIEFSEFVAWLKKHNVYFLFYL